MRPRSFRLLALALVALAAGALPAAASAATWQPVETVSLVRGVPSPQVGIDASGKVTLAYAEPVEHLETDAWTRMWLREPISRWTGGTYVPGARQQQLAVDPSGAVALAAVDAGRLVVSTWAAPGPLARAGGSARHSVTIEEAGTGVHAPKIGIDAAGTATVVWTSPPPGTAALASVEAVTVTAAGQAGPVQHLLGPLPCRPEPTIDVNLRGDAVVYASCAAASGVFYSPAGGLFGTREEIPGWDGGPTGVTIDGAGDATAFRALDWSPTSKDLRDYRVEYSVRPRDGAFGPGRRLTQVGRADGSFAMEGQEDSRTVAAWTSGEGIRYATRLGRGDFGVAQEIRPQAEPIELRLTAAARGPALLSWREFIAGERSGDVQQVAAAVIGADGRAGAPRRLGIPGDLPTGVASFAINEHGHAVGAWEQRCARDGAYAVMAISLDAPGGTGRPPCQDRRGPKVVVVRKRALLAGRFLRVRAACDEACEVVARVRVLVQGRRKPLATAKTREQSLRAARGRWLRLRLSRAEARRIALALAAGRKVNARLAFSVRDRYGNGAVRRPHVPVRR